MAKAKKIPLEDNLESVSEGEIVKTQEGEISDVEMPSKADGLPQGKVNTGYSAQLVGEGVKFVVTSGSLPEGIVMAENTGELTGAPTPEAQGVSNFKVTAYDAEDKSLGEISGQIVVTL